MGIALCVSYAEDEITRQAYEDYPCEISLAVNVLKESNLKGNDIR